MIRPLILFVVCFGILLRTLVPTIYTLDSAEFITGAETLGFVHAPGYPLYLLLLHGFLQLPFGETGVTGNVFSALCLALTVPLVYAILRRLTDDKNVAFSVALVFAWSYYVWLTGLFAEVYALQLLSLAGCGWVIFFPLTPSSPSPTGGEGEQKFLAFYGGCEGGRVGKLLANLKYPFFTYQIYFIGILYGLAVAVHPMNILFAPGMVLAFRLRKIAWRESLLAGGVAVLIFGVTLLYFPIRAGQHPALNMAGQYDWQGNFQAQDLSTPAGMVWMLTGQQFESLMFAEGILPSAGQLTEFFGWFVGNWLGFGFLLGMGGLYALYKEKRGIFWVWVVWFLPYTYFYLTYGAQDKDMMLAPLYVLWAGVLAVGLKALLDNFPPLLKTALLVGLPLLMLAVNFPLLDLSDETSVRERSEALLENLPSDARVFGEWRTMSPLAYYQIVQRERPDLHLYNLFLFPKSDLRIFVEANLARGETVIFTEGEYAQELLGMDYRYEPMPMNWTPPHDGVESLDVVRVYNQDE